MTKIQIITKNDVKATIDESELPVQSAAIKTALAGKVDVNQGTAKAGKFLVVGSDGNVGCEDAEKQAQADWTQTDTTNVGFIKNKPFNTVGTGLTVTGGALTADTQFKFQIFTSLPTAAATYSQTIALIEKTKTETGNIYDEFGCIYDSTAQAYKWERLGSTEFTLTIDQKAAGITINGTALQAADATNTGLMTSTAYTTLTGAEQSANKVSAFQNTPDNTHFPTEKLVKDSLDAKQTTANLVTAFQATPDNTHYASEKLVKDTLDLKQTKDNIVTAFQTTTDDTHYPSEKLVKTSLDTKVTLDGSTSFKIGKDATGYYFDDGE